MPGQLTPSWLNSQNRSRSPTFSSPSISSLSIPSLSIPSPSPRKPASSKNQNVLNELDDPTLPSELLRKRVSILSPEPTYPRARSEPMSYASDMPPSSQVPPDSSITMAHDEDSESSWGSSQSETSEDWDTLYEEFDTEGLSKSEFKRLMKSMPREDRILMEEPADREQTAKTISKTLSRADPLYKSTKISQKYDWGGIEMEDIEAIFNGAPMAEKRALRLSASDFTPRRDAEHTGDSASAGNTQITRDTTKSLERILLQARRGGATDKDLNTLQSHIQYLQSGAGSNVHKNAISQIGVAQSTKNAVDPAIAKAVNIFIRKHIFMQTSLDRFTTSQRRSFERDVYDFARAKKLSHNVAKDQARKARKFCGEETYNSDNTALGEEVDDSEEILRRFGKADGEIPEKKSKPVKTKLEIDSDTGKKGTKRKSDVRSGSEPEAKKKPKHGKADGVSHLVNPDASVVNGDERGSGNNDSMNSSISQPSMIDHPDQANTRAARNKKRSKRRQRKKKPPTEEKQSPGITTPTLVKSRARSVDPVINQKTGLPAPSIARLKGELEPKVERKDHIEPPLVQGPNDPKSEERAHENYLRATGKTDDQLKQEAATYNGFSADISAQREFSNKKQLALFEHDGPKHADKHTKQEMEEVKAGLPSKEEEEDALALGTQRKERKKKRKSEAKDTESTQVNADTEKKKDKKKNRKVKSEHEQQKPSFQSPMIQLKKDINNVAHSLPLEETCTLMSLNFKTTPRSSPAPSLVSPPPSSPIWDGREESIPTQLGYEDIDSKCDPPTVELGIVSSNAQSKSNDSPTPSNGESSESDYEVAKPRRRGKGLKISRSASAPSTPHKSPLKVCSKVSPYFPKPPTKKVSCIPFPALESTSFGLVQEKLCHDPFRLLVAVIFLNKTKGSVAMPVFYDLMGRYPTPADLAAADQADLVDLIQHLGLQNQRAAKCIKLAQAWLETPPERGKRYRRLHYPLKNDGKDIASGESPIADDENDYRVAWEVGHLPGIGAYAIDSWRIFCRDELRGLPHGLESALNPQASAAELGQEWTRVLPYDKELRAYLRWRWLRLGWSWNPLTGERIKADADEWERAKQGGIINEGDDHWEVKSNGRQIMGGDAMGTKRVESEGHVAPININRNVGYTKESTSGSTDSGSSRSESEGNTNVKRVQARVTRPRVSRDANGKWTRRQKQLFRTIRWD